MIFTLTDRSYTPLDAYETSDYLIGSYVGSIIKSLELNIFVKSEHAKDWVEGNYIFCSDSNGYKYWFTIYDANDAHGDATKKLTCYSGTIDIVSEDANPIAMPVTPQPFSWYFDQIFYDTAITIGINELDGLSRSLEFTSENASNAEMLQYVLNGFDNAEADLAVEISGSIPTKVVLNVFRRLGNSESQTLLSDEDDSVTMLERTGSISGLATCLNTVGSGDDPDNPVTLVGKYYEERDENGELLYYSPTDHERVYSVKGRERFFVEIPGKTNGEFDGYINRRYQSQASTQDALWSESLAQLKKIDQPSVTYEAGGHINCRLGDTVQIVSNEMKPPVMISARVLEYKFNDDIPEVNEYKFGNYAILESNIEDMSALLAELKKGLVIISSIEVLYAVDKQGITPPTSGWLASYVSPEPGNWLWTKTVTYLSNNESSVAYSVSRVGEDGATGPTGPQGQATYTWIKYADTPNTGMSNLPDGKTYMGIAYNKTTATESSSYVDYSWSLIKGSDGVQGPTGTQGQATYTWIKYADSPTSGMSDSPTGKKYLGIAYNKTTATESLAYSDYSWSLIEGPQGPQGPQGNNGPQGQTGPPTGIVEQSTIPTSPYVGMLWKNTDDGITRRWNGSTWPIYLLQADNISATNLAAIVANLGIITAGILQSADGTTKLDLNAGTLALGGKFNWNGTNLNIRGNVTVDDDLFMWAPSSGAATAGLHARLVKGLNTLYIGWLPENTSGSYSDYYIGSPSQTAGKLTYGGSLFVNGTAGNVYTTNKKPTPSEIGAEPATVYGSNTNGYYIKFADGTLICYGRKALNTVAIVNPWGSWYVSSPSSATYPVAFVGAPASVSVNMENTTGDIAAWLNGSSTTTSFSGYFARGDSGTLKCTMGWIAIGRWK